MKYTLLAAALCLLFASFAIAQNDEINIVPRPYSIKSVRGSFAFSRKTRIVAPFSGGIRIANRLNEMIEKRYGFRLRVDEGERRFKGVKGSIFILEHGQIPEYGNPEEYRLQVKEDGIELTGTERGMFYGTQSLMQLLPNDLAKTVQIPEIHISDEPRFRYRGMHLDVSRHFFSVEFVKKYIDLMSQYKFNTFHWHLTDDQGWRIEIKKYPKLTEIGSRRPETVKERNLTPYIGDGVPVDGFYTQEQIRDVVAYANARYITVVPEIELPGHASAALAAYPQFGCKADYKYKVQTTWGIFKEVFCPTDETFKFLEDVIDETISLFPDSPYIHIGGDEVLKDHWKESAFVQDLMKRENLKDEHEVQSYFVRRIERYVNSKGKKIIGWDEILEGGLAPNATVMSWRGMKGGTDAAKAKHDVIMTPNDYVYFDYGQGDSAYEPLNIGSYVPLEKVYSFEPVPKELSTDEAKYIIGGQANIWTEYMKTPSHVEYMAFPRMLALSEVLWSKTEDKNFADFNRRLAAQFPRLDKQNVNYRIPEPSGLKNVVLAANEPAYLELTPPVSGAKIYYTTDGSSPNEAAVSNKPATKLYEKRIELPVTQGGRMDVKIVVVLPSGRKSPLYSAVYLRQEMRPAVEPTGKTAGVAYLLTVPNAEALRGETKSIFLTQFAQRPNIREAFGVTFDGFLNVPVDQIYEFQVDSTWDRTIVVDGQMIIDETGTKDRAVRSAVIPLKAGWHKVSFRYNHRGGDMAFRVRYGIKGQGLRQIGGGELVH